LRHWASVRTTFPAFSAGLASSFAGLAVAGFSVGSAAEVVSGFSVGS